METNTLIVIGIGLIASAVAGWWYKKKGNLLTKVADELEDKIEDITGVDVELDDVVDDLVSAAEDVVDEVHDTVVDSLESGDSLAEVVDDAVEAGQEAVDNVEIDVDALKDMTVAALKERLKEAGLPVSGKKAELIERLLEAGV